MPDGRGGVDDVRDALRRRKWTALLVAGLLLTGVVMTVESLPDEYDGEAVVAFSPQPGEDVGADVIRLVLPKYVAYLTSRATARTVANDLGGVAEELRKATDVSVAPETANLEITVRLDDPVRAAEVANELAFRAVELSTVDALLSGRVVAPALPPETPASPPRRLLEIGGLLLALLAGLTTAVILDRSRPRVTDPLTAALVSGHGLVGRIPVSRALRGPPVEVLADPVGGTALRALRTQLQQMARSAPFSVMSVTSSTPGEGKTTVAAALAASFANLDLRVLLVDGDMRRPRIDDLLDLDVSRPGLAQLLEGSATLPECVQKCDVPGLSVVVTERRAEAGDLLARRLPELLATARDRFDLVVLDCPPLLATDDARTLCLAADATLLVVASGTEVGRVGEAAASLESLGVRVLGTVLNRSRIRRREAFGSYGRYGPA